MDPMQSKNVVYHAHFGELGLMTKFSENVLPYKHEGDDDEAPSNVDGSILWYEKSKQCISMG